MKTNKWIYVIMVMASLSWVACDNDDDNANKPSMNDTDENFVEKAALGNLTEMKFAQSASTKATDSLVKAFAMDMISEHTAAQTELQAIANDYGDITWPQDLDAQHKTLLTQLDSLSGFAFDSMYIESQITDHQAAVMTFQTETTTGTVDRVKTYAGKYLPHIQDHFDRADSLQTVLANNHTAGTD
jgi:putative membrane protein